ncbi:MAG: YIP1 family protein [Euryarchaeota archaeon]|nr:YIP1 family protein [Euryarchaeota archaeon]MCG2735708.1 YIP1 family protein [Candidatus Methanoperedenaceae archaeon]
MNFVEKITGIINNPKETMKNIAQEPLIEEAVMIVGIYAVLSALMGYVQLNKVTYIYEGFENMPSSMGSIISITAIVGGLLGAFIIWLIGTGIIHLISMALGGEGKFSPQMMTIVSYSMIPLIFGGIISLLLVFSSEPMTITISRTNPMAANELYNSSNFLISMIVGLLFQIWFTVLLFFGLQSAQNLTSEKSAVIASIPLAITVISLLWSFRSMGIL